MKEELIQILMGMLGTVGFSLLFHVKGKKLIPIALGGALSWFIYLTIVRYYANNWLALMISTTVMGVLAEIFARSFKAPAIIFLVPMLVPLIPGGDLYRTTFYLVQGKTEQFAAQGNLLLREGCAIAFGIILVACLVHFPRRLYKHRQQEEA